MWKGTAATLNARPAVIMSSAICATALVATEVPNAALISVNIVDPTAPNRRLTP